MKKYKAVFFDWDGTAVISRTASADAILGRMEPLLEKGIKLIIVSGTTYDNICGGRLENLLSKKALANLYLGLARGCYNYGFSLLGERITLLDNTPDMNKNLLLHKVCYLLHEELLYKYGFPTDIVFSRPGYCKIDLMVECRRNEDSLFMQDNEVDLINALLKKHGIENGLWNLLEKARQTGLRHGLDLKATTDAKYLELGFTTKSDNVDWFVNFLAEQGIGPEDCCFWGDEFYRIAPEIWGSDAQMITEKTSICDFFSVSDTEMPLPEGVKSLGGGTTAFTNFLHQQEKV